jgi:hypothetical protein
VESKVKTRGGELELLLDTTTAEGVGTLYEKEAAKNAGESKSAWRWGVAILAVAAAVAVLPVALHYFDIGADYSDGRLLLAHFAATAALATLAGVVLARARGRDHARQRATDLATAMGTMIVYSNQIEDPSEKQAFLQTMGQIIILQAQARSDGPPSDESASNIAALISALRSRPSGDRQA